MPYPPTLWGMYWPTEKPFEFLTVTQGDMNLASIAFGWSLGFGYFAVCHAVRESRRARRINTYIILVWGEIIVQVALVYHLVRVSDIDILNSCLLFGILCWLYLAKVIPPSFWFFFFILTIWTLQVQFLLQIIVNRLCILLSNDRQRNWIRWGVAALIFAINVSVYNIWLPSKLQIHHRYHEINIWWDRCEKCLYLVVDGCLNYYFIRTVRNRLVKHDGLTKYAKLVKFNTQIVFVSLSMDVLIITMMSLHNDFVYMLFHPVAYIVKLNIEMAMSNLIIKVARDTGVHIIDGAALHSNSTSAVTSAPRFHSSTMEVQVQVARQQFSTHDDIELRDSKAGWQSEDPDAKVTTSSTHRTSAILFPNSDSVV
ncbi:hypothetical protein BDZ89DRAFT_1133606 [Hymenopellis radicata]|nr:hypothetical protein BDZ89DRAFT_1133606 [Hymenopellis radicata]